MHKQRLEIRIILLAVVIVAYGIVAGAASTPQPPTSQHEAAKTDKAAQLEAKVSFLEASLHK